MKTSEVERAVGATTELASALHLAVGDARIVCNSNKLALRLLPCDVLARVAFAGQEAFASEIEIARLLAETESPVASLEGRVEPRVYARDEFAITFWRYYEQSPAEFSGADYARALELLHAGMARLDVSAPHFTERVREAQVLVESPERGAGLTDSDRELLSTTLRGCSERISERSSPEQLLHGEPHPGNLLKTSYGLLFIDLETCCRGPVEFDLAHVPEPVSECYSGADRDLIRECRRLVLAMVAAWRSDPDDQFPNGESARHALLAALRMGPPWRTLEVVMSQPDVPSRG
jgi:Ser/Thr protein kinase RdoA (MazF antagonist)